MKTKDKLLPYPVLGNYDAVYPMLTDDAVVMPVPQRDENDYIFHIELNQRNQDITKLIGEGKAEYLCEVYCKNTLLRQRYTSSEPLFDFRLGRNSMLSLHKISNIPISDLMMISLVYHLILKEAIFLLHSPLHGLTRTLRMRKCLPLVRLLKSRGTMYKN